jgi:hypothetical protein
MVATCSYFSDNVDTEIQPFEIRHCQECSRHDFSDQVSTQIQILERLQVLKIAITNRL